MTQEQYLYFAKLKTHYLEGLLSSEYIADSLAISRRQAQRYLNAPPITHKRAWNRLSEETINCIRKTKENNPDCNCQWISELVSDYLAKPVSRSSVYRILSKEKLLPKVSLKRKTRSRFEAEFSGDLVQMDTTWGYWWNSHKLCLILLLDDHSRYILLGRFVEHDTAAENMKLIKEMVEEYGVPKILYTDNASFFKTIRHGDSRHQAHSKAEYETEIGRACSEAGITHLTHKPYQPQGKGKIERLFRFIQERFVSTITDEMTLGEINTHFIKWKNEYNAKHKNRTTGCVPKERFDPKGFKPLSLEKSLEDIFCWKCTRKVDACNQFSLDGSIYTIPNKDCMVAFKVSLHVTPGEYVRVWHDDKLICTLSYLKSN